MMTTEKGYVATAVMKLPGGKTAALHTREDSRLWRE